MDRILRGTVTRTDAQGAYVEIPKLGIGVEFGPCQVLSPFVLDRRTELAGGHGHSVSHSMGGSDAAAVATTSSGAMSPARARCCAATTAAFTTAGPRRSAAPACERR